MTRIRLDNTAMLEELHAKSIKRVFCNSQAREEALQQLRDRLQEVCKAQAPAKVRCTCPGCDRDSCVSPGRCCGCLQDGKAWRLACC